MILNNEKWSELNFDFFSYSLPSPSFPTSMPNASPHPYNFMPYNSSDIPSSSFIFQDLSNYSHQKEFNGEL